MLSLLRDGLGSGRKFRPLSDEMLASLSVWSEVHPSWCTNDEHTPTSLYQMSHPPTQAGVPTVSALQHRCTKCHTHSPRRVYQSSVHSHLTVPNVTPTHPGPLYQSLVHSNLTVPNVTPTHPGGCTNRQHTPTSLYQMSHPPTQGHCTNH